MQIETFERAVHLHKKINKKTTEGGSQPVVKKMKLYKYL